MQRNTKLDAVKGHIYVRYPLIVKRNKNLFTNKDCSLLIIDNKVFKSTLGNKFETIIDSKEKKHQV